MFTPNDLMFSYSRKQALADGVLVDASDSAKDAGLKFPVALTRSVWDRYVEFDEKACPDQDMQGRLWDVLFMLRVYAGQTEGSEIRFSVYVAMPDRGNWEANEDVPAKLSGLTRETHRVVELKAMCGPGDRGEPVITVMLPHED